MAGIKGSNLGLPCDFITSALVTLAFLGSIGMTMVILGCALPSYKSWWPFVVVIFYILAPLPTMFTKGYNDRTSSNVNMDLAIFITMGFVVSSFALPIVMARAPVHAPVIKWGACNLTLIGNVIVYLTYIGYFVTLYQDDSHYALRF